MFYSKLKTIVDICQYYKRKHYAIYQHPKEKLIKYTLKLPESSSHQNLNLKHIEKRVGSQNHE